MDYIVAGPSCSGKSTFLESAHRVRYLPGTADHATVYPSAGEVSDAPGTILHYNIANPVLRLAQRSFAAGRPERLPVPEFDREDVCRGSVPGGAVVLVAPTPVLRDRASRRHVIERTIEMPYNGPLWESIYDNLDLAATYRAFVDALERWGVPYVLVDSTTPEYEPLRSWGAAERLLAGGEPPRPLLDVPVDGDEPYQAGSTGDVDMRGTYDRAGSFPIVFDRPIIGSTVLDIGCAEGLFCFEAEARGAAEVLGIDVRGERLERARATARAIGSRVRFADQDLSDLPQATTYERVLMLNVIHHLPEPLAALGLVSRVTERDLVLEFPTLDDPKFCRTIPDADLRSADRLPLIGVSTAAMDQTYVFTEQAIARILLEHTHEPFDDVAFAPSPNPSRRIAIARRL